MFLFRKLNFKSYKVYQKAVVSGFIFLAIFLSGKFILNSIIDFPIGLTHYSINAYLLIAILLIPLNVLCESLKLYYNLHQSLCLIQATRQVCKGFTFGLFFPFGLGAYAGRIFLTKKEHVGEFMKITAVSSFAQMNCNLIFGVLLGFSMIKELFHIQSLSLWLPLLLSLSIFGICIFAFIWQDHSEYSILNKVNSFLQYKMKLSWSKLTSLDLVVLSGLSIIRYLIYCLQSILVLMSFTSIGFMEAISAVAIFFFMLSLIYLPGLLSVLSRSAIACFVFSSIGLQNDQAIYFSWFIFMLNIVIPAMFGIYYLFGDSMQTER